MADNNSGGIANAGASLASSTIKKQENKNMWGTIISAVVSIVGSIFSSSAAKKKENEAKQAIAVSRAIEQAEADAVKISGEYSALMSSLQQKYGGTLKPSFSGNGKFNVYSQLSDSDIAALNQFAGKAVGTAAGKTYYGLKFSRSSDGSVIAADVVAPAVATGASSNILTSTVDAITGIFGGSGSGSGSGSSTALPGVSVNGSAPSVGNYIPVVLGVAGAGAAVWYFVKKRK